MKMSMTSDKTILHPKVQKRPTNHHINSIFLSPPQLQATALLSNSLHKSTKKKG